jgi:hypothetical protein
MPALHAAQKLKGRAPVHLDHLDKRKYHARLILALRRELVSHVVGPLRPTQNAQIERVCLIQLRIMLWDQKLLETGEQSTREALHYSTLVNSFERQREAFIASCKVREIMEEAREPPPQFTINVLSAVYNGDGSIARLDRVASFTYGDPVPSVAPAKRTRPRLDGAVPRSAAEVRERLKQRELTDAEIAERLARVNPPPPQLPIQERARRHFIGRAGVRLPLHELIPR